MSIEAIAANSISTISDVNKNNLVSTYKNNNNTSFEDFLKDSLNNINEKQVDADMTLQKALSGENKNIHEVMIATDEAKISLDLAIQIRNKLIEAYQDINRIQI